MKTAKDYPITYKYGYHADYPTHDHFHRGVDRAMPVGTPVVVNGKQIGLSGNTGLSTGPHLHIGKYYWSSALRKVVYVNPRKLGFRMLGTPKVDSVGENALNGKFVRIKSHTGKIYVYCHLSKITCKAGDKIK